MASHRIIVASALAGLALAACSASDVLDRPSVDVGAVTQAVPARTGPTPPATVAPQTLRPEALATAPVGTELGNRTIAAQTVIATPPGGIADEAASFVGMTPPVSAAPPASLSPSTPLLAGNAPQASATYGFVPGADTGTDIVIEDVETGAMMASEPEYSGAPAMTVAPVAMPAAPVAAAPSIAARLPAAGLGATPAPAEKRPTLLAGLLNLPGKLLPNTGGGALGASEAACRKQLKSLGVVWEEAGTIGNPGGRSCGIANAVRVKGLSGGITVKPAALLNCRMALAFAQWVKKDVNPAARSRYLSGVDTIHQMSSYSCRTIGNRRGGTLSEHSFGNAIDIGRITLNNGASVTVRKPAFFSLRESSLLNKIRSDACDRFTTVLGPGYNADHADHFHFDLMSRRNRTCK